MNNTTQEKDSVLNQLRDPHTIRDRAQKMLQLGQADKLNYFTVDMAKMADTAAFVSDVILDQYPKLDIPYHSRWRHFEINGISRIPAMLTPALSPQERGVRLYELVILSVFLDAGAGPLWHYKDLATGMTYSRSEGLAIASLDLYQNGHFSSQPADPKRVDAQRLLDFNEHDFQEGFQVTSDNPLEGVSGRVALLNRLGALIQKNPVYFGSHGRLGDFYTYISSLAQNKQIPATKILHAVLAAFNEVWPMRTTYQQIPLGDVWKHPALKTEHPGSEYMPFHKLSQWLTYSLIEPLEQAGIEVTGLNELTGLPEYRNGGLFIDTGLLKVKNEALLQQAHHPDSEFIVEWRALTVALLDELALQIRTTLQQNEHDLPLAKILQGGTWEAGRRIARQKRPQGIPPIQIISDGTVF